MKAFYKHLTVVFRIGVSTNRDMHIIGMLNHKPRWHKQLHEFTSDPVVTISELLKVGEFLGIILCLGVILSNLSRIVQIYSPEFLRKVVNDPFWSPVEKIRVQLEVM